jgi:pimeloyl-ACP methyl ester carboxylesterase
MIRLSFFAPSENAAMTAGSEAAILSRVIGPEKKPLPAAVARVILRWDFPDVERRRMHELLENAKAGTLTRGARAEAENYERIGHLLFMEKPKEVNAALEQFLKKQGVVK